MSGSSMEQYSAVLALTMKLEQADMAVLLRSSDGLEWMRPTIGAGTAIGEGAWVELFNPDLAPFASASRGRCRVTVFDATERHDELARFARAVGFTGLDVLPLVTANGRVVGLIARMWRRPYVARPDAQPCVAYAAQVASILLECEDRRRAAEEGRARAERQSRDRLQFLARMTHELRTPLQSIAGYADLLRIGAPEPPTPGQVELLERLSRGERVLSSVIANLITFARIEAGELDYSISPVIARDVLAATEIIMTPMVRERGITLVVDGCPGDLVISADSDKTLQILINLTANALKFTGRGGTVHLGGEEGPDGMATFYVQDTGCGIPKEKLETIFAPYVQLERSSSDRRAGSGLGLAISREFASAMKGALTAESGVGGSTFYLCLPRYISTMHSLRVLPTAELCEVPS